MNILLYMPRVETFLMTIYVNAVYSKPTLEYSTYYAKHIRSRLVNDILIGFPRGMSALLCSSGRY